MYKLFIQQWGQMYPSPWWKSIFLFIHASKSFWKIHPLNLDYKYDIGRDSDCLFYMYGYFEPYVTWSRGLVVSLRNQKPLAASQGWNVFSVCVFSSSLLAFRCRINSEIWKYVFQIDGSAKEREENVTSTHSKQQRLKSLDTFRG